MLQGMLKWDHLQCEICQVQTVAARVNVLHLGTTSYLLNVFFERHLYSLCEL